MVLGNLDPKVQLSVLNQFDKKPEFIMLDTMNFWMNNSLDDLLEVIKKVDLICINDEEVLQLSNSKNINEGVSKILTMGPKYIIMKRGEYGASVYSSSNKFTCKSYPVDNVIDPTGAGDSFAGGFIGYLSKSNDLTFENMKTAVIYGSVMASFCVEKFGTERLTEIKQEDVKRRAEEFVRLSNFKL